MRTLLPIALAALVGCGGSGLDPQGVDVKILDLEPEEGPLTGGTPVTITGLGFDPGALGLDLELVYGHAFGGAPMQARGPVAIDPASIGRRR